jgi:hypothetical protein
MINTTGRTLHQYLIGDLRIVELHSLAHGQAWTIFRDLNIIVIRADLTGEDRERALGQALNQMRPQVT